MSQYVVIRDGIVVQEIDAMCADEAIKLRSQSGRLFAQVADDNDIEDELQAMTVSVKP
jgi:hypothetical protein